MILRRIVRGLDWLVRGKDHWGGSGADEEDIGARFRKVPAQKVLAQKVSLQIMKSSFGRFRRGRFGAENEVRLRKVPVQMLRHPLDAVFPTVLKGRRKIVKLLGVALACIR